MNDLDRLEQALEHNRLSPTVFERCAQDLLTDLYPGLSPIPGGSDWGRDSDIAGSGSSIPPRLLATSSRSLDGVRKNMVGGISSMRSHGVCFDRIVLANPASLRLPERQKLVDAAQKEGARLDPSDIFDRGFFASRLRRDGYWRKQLLGLPSGPITLARLPADLAEAAWSFLPLVAREDDLAALQGEDDVIVTGPPGVGKSRLVTELEGAVFVDKDASFEQLAADLRWTLPAVVVVDDGGSHGSLIRRLIALRQSERDLFGYRLVVVCWPDEVEPLRSDLSSTRLVELSLVERAPLGDLLMMMGIAGQLARGEILDQAEGRPGWAVALADLLIRTGDPTSLLQGKALFGQVERYLFRAGIGREAIDLLAIVAALAGVTELELRDLASEVAMSRTAAASLLGTASGSGLIDVGSKYSWEARRNLRIYTVRPPMLADVLVAERGFDAPAPVIDFDGLGARWPGHLAKLTRGAIRAAQFGATGALQTAERLYDDALSADDVDRAAKVELSVDYLRLGASAAARVMEVARASFDEAAAAEDIDGWVIEPIVKLASLAARWFRSRAAIELLLDACLIDLRPTNSNPGHPLRQIDDLVADFHPEVPRSERLRHEIAGVLEQWLAREPTDPERHRVVSEVMATLFTLRLHSAHSDPARPMTIQLIESIVPGDEIEQIYSDLWPRASKLLDQGVVGLADALIDVAGNWLRVGGGYDRPFGRDHDAGSIAAAKVAGEALVRELASRRDLSLGSLIHLRSTAAWHDVAVEVDVPTDVEPFFRELDRDEDWRSAEEALISDLRALGVSWADDDPTRIIARLMDLQVQLEQAKLQWPDRPWIVCMALAEHVADPMVWLETAEEAGFMPHGVRFAERALQDGLLTEPRLRALLSTPTTRHSMVQIVLAAADPPSWATSAAIESLAEDDYRLVETGFLRGEYSGGLVHDLLTKPAPSVRAMVAVALFIGEHHKNPDWAPDDLEAAWLNALSHLRPAQLPLTPHYDITKLFGYLAQRYPDTLAALLIATLGGADDGEVYRALPHDTRDVLHRLPASQKLRIWRQFKERPWAGYLLQEHLVGSDVDWLRELIEAGEITPDEALSSFRGFGPQPPLAALAKLLVPMGVDPDRIAGLRFSGSWIGDESARYAGLVESFESMASEDDDPSVRAVASAGVRIFAAARDQAAERERQQRIRGER